MTRSVRGSLILLALCGFALPGCRGCSPSPAEHRARAAEYVKEGKLKEAELELRNALKAEPRNAAAHKTLAEISLKNRNFKQAFQEYHAVVSLTPDDVDARLAVSGFYFYGKHFEDARIHAARAVELAPARFDAHEKLGMAEAGLKHLDVAVRELEKAVELAPAKENLWLDLARVRGAAKDRAGAERALEEGLKANPKSLLLHSIQAEFLVSEGRAKEADALMERFAASSGDDPKVLGAVAGYRLKRGDPGGAESLLQRSVAAAGADKDRRFRALDQLAEFYSMTGKTPKALETLEQARTLLPESDLVVQKMANLHLLANQPQQAEPLVRRLEERDPKNVETRLLRARLQLEGRHVQEARGELEKIVAEVPRSVNGNFFLGLAYAAGSEWAKAKAAYQKALAQAPGHVFATLDLARVDLELGQPAEAVELTTALLNRVPGLDAARRVRAAALLRSRDARGAEAEYRTLLKSSPRDAALSLGLAAALAAQGKNGPALEALRDVRRAAPKAVEPVLQEMALLDRMGKGAEAGKAGLEYLKANGDVAPVLHALAGRAIGQKEYGAAKAFLARSVAADPNSAANRELEGLLAVAQGDAEGARRAFEAALKIAPDRASTLLLAADLANKQGKRAEAAGLYERVLRVQPENALAANNLAMIDGDDPAKLGEALRLARIAVERSNRSPAALDTLGWVQLKSGTADTAVATLEEARKAAPKSPEIAYHLGVAYQKVKRPDRARALLTEAVNAKEKGEWGFEAAQALKELDGTGGAQDSFNPSALPK